MRYLFAVIASRSGTVMADENEGAAIDAFNDKLESEGRRLMAVGISSPEGAKVFDNRAGAGLVSDGPVVDSDDFMAGFWVIEAENDRVAHELAAEASLACNRRIEVRAIFG